MAVQAGQVVVGLELDASRYSKGMHQASQQLGSFSSQIAASGKQMGLFSGAATKAGLAVGALGFSLLKFGKSSFSVAADVNEMNVAMEAVGKATGKGGRAIKDAADKVRSMGIEMKASQEIAMLFVKSNINLAQAHEMARVAQDLAVLSQSNSTETARTLVYAIQTGNSILLKSAGITKYASEAYAQYARQLKKSSTALTAAERQQAVLNMVLDEGKKVAGVYEASMQQAGKVLRSFPRIVNDIQLEFGRLYVDGFGPVILAAYKVLSEFSKMIREGGVLAPVMKMLTEVFNTMLKPLKGVFDNMALGLKKISMMSFNTESLKANIEKLLPSVVALGTALSMLAARNILTSIATLFPMFRPLAGLIGVGGPLVAGLAVMGILTPELRDSFMKLVEAVKPLAEPLKEFATIATQTFTVLIDTATELAISMSDSLVGVFQAFASVLKVAASTILPLVSGVASLIGFLAQFQGVLQVIITMIAAKWLIGLVSINTTLGVTGTLVTSLGAKMGVLGKQFSLAFLVSKTTGMKTFASLAVASKVAFGSMANAARAAGLAIASSLAPLIAITVAVTVALKVFQAWSSRNKDVEETTKRVNDVIKEQIKALGGASDKIVEYLNQTNLLSQILNDTEESGEKVVSSMNYLGISTDESAVALAKFKDATEKGQRSAEQYAQELIAGSNTNTKYAEAIAATVAAQDKNFSRTTLLAEVRRRVGDYSIELTETEYKLAEALEELQDQSENTDFAKMRKNLADATLLASKYGGKAVKAADEALALAESQNKFSNEAEKSAFYAQELAKAVENAAKKNGELSNSMPTLAAENAAKALYGLNKQLLEGELTADIVKKALFGTEHALLENSRAAYNMDKALGKTLDQVKAAKGNFTKLKDAGYELLDQFAANIQKITELEGTTKDQLDMMEAQTAQFIKSAKAAGFEEQEINKLLDSLGILASIKNIKTTLELNTENARKELAEYYRFLSLAVTGEQKKKIEAAMSELRKQIDQTNNSTVFGSRAWNALGQAQDKSAKKTATLKDAQEKLNEMIKRQKRAVIEAKQALQDYARSATSSMYQAVRVTTVYEKVMANNAKNEQIRERNKQISAQMEADRVAKQREDARKLVDDKNKLIDAENELIQLQNEFANSVGQSVSAVLSFSGALSEQQGRISEYENALASQSAAQEKFNAVQEEYVSASDEVMLIQEQLAKTTGRYARRVLQEELVKAQDVAAKALENFTNAQGELQEATEATSKAQQEQITFLQSLEQQAVRAAKFGSIIEQLSAAGLSQDALSQIASAGAEAGTVMGEELLAGGIDAISKANKFSEQILAEGKRVTSLFSKTLKQRLEYEVYEDKPVYEELGKEVGLSFAEALKQQSEKSKEFAEKVKKLISMGLRGKQLEEVLNAGVEAGTEIADALIEAGADAIQDSVAVHAELLALSQQLADSLTPYFDQTGVILAESLLKAMQKRLAELPKILKGMDGKDIYEFVEGIDDWVADTSRDIASGIGASGSGTPPIVVPPVEVPPVAVTAESALKSYGFNQEYAAGIIAQGIGSPTTVGGIPDYLRVLQEAGVRMFASGGIVTAPTLGVVGEAGAEAIIPLSKLGNLGGNNYNITVNAGMGANGSQIGAQIVEAIKKYEKSNGTRWRS